MAGNEKDVVIRFVGKNLVGGTAKSVIADLEKIRTRVSSLSSTFKFAFGFAIGGGIGNFLKKTLREATEEGSELQKSLGGGAQAVKDLSQALGDIKLGIQQATLGILSELNPALKAAANIAKDVGQSLGGGPQGTLKSVIDDRKSRSGTTRDTIALLTGERDQLQARLATMQKVADSRRTGLSESILRFLPGLGVGAEAQNQFDLVKATLGSINVELKVLQTNLAAIEAEEMRLAFRGMRNAVAGVTGILEQTGRGLIENAGRMGGNLLDRARAGLNQWRTEGIEAQRQRAQAIIEGGRTPAEQAREELAELNRLRMRGMLNGDQYARAREGLADRLRGMFPGQGQVHGLSATESRTLTRGVDRNSTDEKQLREAERQTKILGGVEKLLEEMNRGKLAVVER